MKQLFFIFSVFILFSCQQETPVTQKKYFDLDTFIKKIIQQQTENKPFIEKQVSINGKQETIKTKAINWQKELELFTQLDLNKQAYQVSYAIKDSANFVIYTLKEGEDLPVKFLKISLDSLHKTPISMEAKMKTKNYLYTADKQLKMNLENGLLKSYQLRGSQELFLGSKKEFSINGKIVSAN